MGDHYANLDGLALSGFEPDTGVEWRTIDIDWWNSPAPSPSSTKRPRAHGVWVGELFLPGRTVTIGGTMLAPTPAIGEEAVNRLIAAAALEKVPLQLVSPLRPLTVMVVRSGEVIAKPRAGLLVWDWSVQLLAEDPRKLGEALSGATGLPSTSGGLTVPFTVPFTIASSMVSGQISLNNPGNIAGPVQLRIDGPVSAPVVTHVNSGRQLVFASSLTLSAGEFLTVDMDRREVLAQGQASRSGWITSRGWAGFEKGDNTWTFTAAGVADPAARLTVTATPAWM